MTIRRTLPLILALAVVVGCEDGAPSRDEEPSAPAVTASRFEPARAGRVTGRVWWAGALPTFAPISAPFFEPGGKVTYRSFANPNLIHVDPERNVVAGAVVMLEGVAPEASRPWDRPSVRVEIDVDRIHVIQGSATRIGFVRVADEVEMRSRDDAVHVLSSRGAAFFGLAFPKPNRSLKRRFEKPGLVELSSGAGRYWHRAYLWVCDHSYIALTDDEGRFDLTGVPPGEYRLVAWHPNGDIARVDNDPNTGMVLRYHFAEPIHWSRFIIVAPNANTNVDPLLAAK